MGATTEKSHNPGREMLINNSMQVLRAFMECSDEIQHGIIEMAQIIADPQTSDEEKAAAEDTLLEALYPEYTNEEIGIDSREYEAINKDHQPEIENELDEEEATFSARLNETMLAKGITQAQLAEAIGVGQPAISMMLSRTCRPQSRTVEKLAKALDVSVEELWSDR